MSASRRSGGSVSFTCTDLSTITATLHTLQQQMQQMASSMQLLSSTFTAIAHCSQNRTAATADDEEEKATVYEESDSRANTQPDTADDDEDDGVAVSGEADERRRDNSRVMRALEEEEKRYDRPAPLTMASSGALTYSTAAGTQRSGGNVWKKATPSQSTSSSSASAVLGVASLSPTRAVGQVTSSPTAPPVPSSVTTLPPLSSTTTSASFAQRSTASRATLLSDTRRQSTDGSDESFASLPATLASPFSVQQQQPTKRATSPLPASHTHPATHSAFYPTSTAEGRSSRSSSDTPPTAATAAAAFVASPRSARPATAHSPPTQPPQPRPLPASLDDLDDLPTAHLPHTHLTAGTHPFPSSTPTSPLYNKHIFLSHPNKVKLNVGGTLFHTTLTTLTSPPAHSSMLHAMFAHSSHFPLELDDKGAVFLDRDPQLFRFILNYLRDGSLPLSSLSAATKLGLLREARYFGLSGLMREVQAEVREMKRRERRELSQEKEYKCCVGVDEKELTALMHRMCMMEGYDFEDWIVAGNSSGGGGSGSGGSGSGSEVRGGRGGSLGGLSMGGLGGGGSGGGKEVGGRLHVLFSKKLSRGELMLLDRLQTGM